MLINLYFDSQMPLDRSQKYVLLYTKPLCEIQIHIKITTNIVDKILVVIF